MTKHIAKALGSCKDTQHVHLAQVKEQADLSRDVIKSDTAEVAIPELDLHITTGSLGGLITTVEGLATSVQVLMCCRRTPSNAVTTSESTGLEHMPLNSPQHSP